MLYFLRNEKTKLLFCTTGILLRKLAVCPLFNLTLLNLWFLSLSQIMFHQQIFRGQLFVFPEVVYYKNYLGLIIGDMKDLQVSRTSVYCFAY